MHRSKTPFQQDKQKPSTLSRGQACFHCRKRKMRCDGVRPVCGQCARANRSDDCEYTGSGRHRAQVEILEESISIVEARIRELENPQAVLARPGNPQVTLRDPYYLQQHQQGPRHGPSRPSTPARGQHQSLPDFQAGHSGHAFAVEPSRETVKLLIDTFLPYSSEFGFFLNPRAFRDTALLQHPIGHPGRPLPALLFAVYLCSLRLPGAARAHQDLESTFLSTALAFVSTALSPTPGFNRTEPPPVLHTMQAHILLAHWFFCAGRFLEGKYHAGAAISLGLGTSLHVQSPSSGQVSAHALPPSRDSVEEEERRGACWVAITMDKVFAAALKQEPMIDLRRNVQGPHGERCVLEIPWPLDRWESADEGLMSQNERYSTTFHDFLNRFSTSDLRVSVLSMFAKATILWQHVEGLSRDWNPSMHPNQLASFQTAFSALDRQLDRLRTELTAPAPATPAAPAAARMRFVALSLAHAASIQLHSIPPVQNFPNARAGRMTSARAVLNMSLSPPQPMEYIHPIIGTVLITASQAVLDELNEMRANRVNPEYPSQEEIGLADLLNRSVSAMRNFASLSPLLRYQTSRIREAWEELDY
ncbi:hypothetical protein C8F01DRAFT_1288186 [Mycena amicta]|nr:hypothetical protein C8F01DRAFT_1288186 [Mycena amicta]